MRIRDVGQDSLDQPVRLVEPRGPLGLVGRPKARVERLLRASGCDEVACHLQRAASRLQESVGRPGVRTEPLREHGVAGDRLLGQRVPPRVPIARARLLVEKLLRNRLLERRQHGLFVRLRHLDEQPVVERAPEHRSRPQHVDVLVVEPAETQEHGLAHGLRELEGVERAPVPAGVRLGKTSPRSIASLSISSRTNGFPSVRSWTNEASSGLTSSALRIAAIISATCAGVIASTETVSASPPRRQVWTARVSGWSRSSSSLR